MLKAASAFHTKPSFKLKPTFNTGKCLTCLKQCSLVRTVAQLHLNVMRLRMLMTMSIKPESKILDITMFVRELYDVCLSNMN